MRGKIWDFGGDWAARLRYRCEQPISDICDDAAKMGDCSRIDTEDGPLIWVKRGSSVLGCAHMDFVNVQHRWAWDRNRGRIFTPRLDDRAGVFMLLDVLPSLGVNLDFLLTDNEETGRSTAKRYCDWLKSKGGPAKVDYNWLAQFDRRGDDVVTYRYDGNKEWEPALKKAGFKVGYGSFSDIAALYDMEVCGVNIGVGYHNEHSTRCYGVIAEMLHNLRVFLGFYESQKGIKWPYTEDMRPKYTWSGYTSTGYQYYRGGYAAAGGQRQIGFENRKTEKMGDSDEICANCGDKKHWIDMGFTFCKECEWWIKLSDEEKDLFLEKGENESRWIVD